ncbi:Katanin p80 WD40 repeat-containing subunit B1 [Ceratobasidium sp. AG-Ba]|nr:Katanin p80 WD40 repeat-containing subunit B1 [Ceratobasidium sp. AG-Ba]QRW03661.1 Katanin p80 WD40 repeat-containing subunit B1 [Ceratobasidium sp. AG-Ba]
MQTSDASNFFRSEADLIAEDARAQKAAKTKNLGNPIELKGKVIRLAILDGDAWTAESGGVVRRVNLVTRKSLQVFKGHTGPVTCLAFFPVGGKTLLLSGSWDQTIRAWDAETGALVSTTKAHSDFLKTLLVIPQLNLLVSGSSDKHIKLWDLTTLTTPSPTSLPQIGSSTGHTRPVECIVADPTQPITATRVYSADSMGVIKVWSVETHPAPTESRRLTLLGEMKSHTMGITDMWAAYGRVWSSSTDDTVRVQSLDNSANPISIPHSVHVKSLMPVHLTPAAAPVLLTGGSDGAIRVWDLQDADDASTIDGREASAGGVIDVHSHDVSALALWVRDPAAEKDKETEDEIKPVKQVEAWIVSASLDGTLRRWKLQDLVDGKHNTVSVQTSTPTVTTAPATQPSSNQQFAMSEEEERELAELMSDEDL